MKEVFITGLGCVSAQKTFDNSSFLDEIIVNSSNLLKCQDANYKEFIPSDMLRRMSRIIRFGVTAGKICLADAGCQLPDAIITGTGLGCIEDTEKFLSNMITNKEEFLTPTSFIQSTHNTVSAQIALLLKCHSYNFTYVHRALSFETALLDSFIQLDSGNANTVLLGGMDEMTANTFRIMQRLGYYKSRPIENLNLLKDNTRGSIAGEGASFFMLSATRGHCTYARINEPLVLFQPFPEEIPVKLTEFLSGKGITLKDIDLVLMGLNGDPANDKVYHDFENRLGKIPSKGYYKHLSGEHFTASAFGLWLATKILHHQRIPEPVSLSKTDNQQIRNILLYNHFRNTEHAFILVSLP